MFSFMMQFSRITVELGNLLQVQFIPGSSANQTVVGRVLANILKLHNAKHFKDRDVELMRMAFLVKHLSEIDQAKPELLAHFRQSIVEAGGTDSFFGTRFEINIAATLVRESIPFIKQESPDFRILKPYQGTGIECTSARIRKDGPAKDFFYKVRSKAREKTHKNYADPSTALFIDITNTFFTSLRRGSDVDTFFNRERLRNLIGGGGFGNLTLFTYLVDNDLDKIESSYIRADHGSISTSLANLLDVAFPFGNRETPNMTIPFEG